MENRMVALVVVLVLSLGWTSAQEDFSDAIKCYVCEGSAENSTCADPIEDASQELEEIECDNGVCIKWTKYNDGELIMKRTCSQKVDFHLTMVDSVCRSERNGNGWLCMCGKALCNGASGLWIGHSLGFLTVLAMVVSALSHRV